MENNNYKIEYLPSFGEELNGIMYYITYILQNKKAAEKLLDNINRVISERSINPESYLKYKSNKNGEYIWYRINVDNYTIFYTVRDYIMEIAHILYGRRNFDKLI